MTGHLKSYLSEALPAARRALVPKAPQPLLLERAVARMAAVGGGALSPEDADARLRQVVSAFRAGGANALTPRLVRSGCGLYFHGSSGPANDDALARALVERVEQLQSHMGLSALIDAFLDSSNDQAAAASRLLSRLAPLAVRWPWQPWNPRGEALRRFSLLDLDRAPQLIADHVLGNPRRPVSDCLSDASLTTPARQQGRLATMAFIAASLSVAARRGADVTAQQARLMDWAGLAGGTLAYPTAWPHYANALLLPWLNAAPPVAHGTNLRAALIAYGGDPRINKTRWIDVQKHYGQALSVLMRWLTQNSFRMFFDLVSKHLTDRLDMWEERRAFWEQYLNKGLVDEAWVVLGSDLARAAERLRVSTGDPSYGMYGLLATGGGRTSQHAALIMRIDRITVVEWSHNGKWNIWPDGDGGGNGRRGRAPQLYRMSNTPLVRRSPDYQASELMEGPYNGPHDAPGRWKERVTALIYSLTGRRPS